MRTIFLIIALALPGCKAHIELTTTDPETGITDRVTVESARRTAISTSTVTIITGQVAISDETVQVLAKEGAKAVTGKQD